MEHINQLSDSERNQHKKNVLCATLQYLRNPNDDNQSELEQAKWINTRFKGALPERSSATADLVDKTIDLIRGILEKNKVTAEGGGPSLMTR